MFAVLLHLCRSSWGLWFSDCCLLLLCLLEIEGFFFLYMMLVWGWCLCLCVFGCGHFLLTYLTCLDFVDGFYGRTFVCNVYNFTVHYVCCVHQIMVLNCIQTLNMQNSLVFSNVACNPAGWRLSVCLSYCLSPTSEHASGDLSQANFGADWIK